MREIGQSDVYSLDFGPSPRSAPAERHPGVVVQSDVFNRSRIATTVVRLITSNVGRAAAPGNVALRKKRCAPVATERGEWISSCHGRQERG
ncbi:MAG: type II toxin-antitoxin system PemK/MazF family toxin [Bryobacteraceae bacterium]